MRPFLRRQKIRLTKVFQGNVYPPGHEDFLNKFYFPEETLVRLYENQYCWVDRLEDDKTRFLRKQVFQGLYDRYRERNQDDEYYSFEILKE